MCIALIFSFETGIYFPYRWQVFWLVVFLFFFSSFGYFFGKLFKPQLSDDIGLFKRFSVRFFGIRPLIFSLFFLSTADFLYSGGFPLFSFFAGSGPTSTNYGMPLIHGLQKAIQFLLFTYVIANRNYFSFSLLMLILLPFLELSRSSLLIYFLFTIIYNLTKEQIGDLIYFFYLTAILSLGVFFIIFGNTRDNSALTGLVEGTNLTVIFFYTYFVSGLSNFSDIILRDEGLVLIYGALNSTTGWYPLYNYGSIYLLTLGAIVIGIISGLLSGEVKARYIPLKAIFSSGLALMFFGNFLFNNAYLFMIIFLFLFSRVWVFSKD